MGLQSNTLKLDIAGQPAGSRPKSVNTSMAERGAMASELLNLKDMFREYLGFDHQKNELEDQILEIITQNDSEENGNPES